MIKRIFFISFLLISLLSFSQRNKKITGNFAGIYGGWGAELNSPCLGIKYGERLTENIIMVPSVGIYFEKEEFNKSSYITKNAYEANINFEVVFGNSAFKFQPLAGIHYIYLKEKSTAKSDLDSSLVDEFTYAKTSHNAGILIGFNLRFDMVGGINPYVQVGYLAGGLSQLYVIGGVVYKFEFKKGNKRRRY